MPALSTYIVVTEDGHICKPCERRRDAEEWTVAFARTLGERIRISLPDSTRRVSPGAFASAPSSSRAMPRARAERRS